MSEQKRRDEKKNELLAGKEVTGPQIGRRSGRDRVLFPAWVSGIFEGTQGNRLQPASLMMMLMSRLTIATLSNFTLSL